MANSHWTRVRVLVIDDSEAARAAINGLLAPAGYEVHQLPSAIGATRIILRSAIEAVIIDVSMPGLSGDRLVELLRSNPRFNDLVIILVSGDPEHLKRISEKLEVDGAIAKSQIGARLELTLARALASVKRRSHSGVTPKGEPNRQGNG